MLSNVAVELNVELSNHGAVGFQFNIEILGNKSNCHSEGLNFCNKSNCHSEGLINLL